MRIILSGQLPWSGGLVLAATVLAGCEMPTSTLGSKSGSGTPVASTSGGTSTPAASSNTSTNSKGGESGKVFYPPGGGPSADDSQSRGATGNSSPDAGSTGPSVPGHTTPGHDVPGHSVPGTTGGGRPIGPLSGSPPQEPPKGGSVTSTRVSLRLSAGVALAQTLPNGTGMLFSVDYRFSARANDQSMLYYWVIVPANGRPITQDVSRELKAKNSGTLSAIVPGLQPEVGPFQCRIEIKHPADSRPNDVTGLTRMVSENVPR